MMKSKLATLFTLLLLPFCIATVATTGSASAWGPFGSVDCSGKAKKSAVCQDRGSKGNPLVGKDGLLLKVTNIFAIIAGIAAVIIIVLAGLRYVLSEGNPEQASGAKRAILFALAGIVIIVVARSIIALVLGRL